MHLEYVEISKVMPLNVVFMFLYTLVDFKTHITRIDPELP